MFRTDGDSERSGERLLGTDNGVGCKGRFIHLCKGIKCGFAYLDVDVLDIVREKQSSGTDGDLDAMLGGEGTRIYSDPNSNGTKVLINYTNADWAMLVYSTFCSMR